MRNPALLFLLIVTLGLCAGVSYVFVLANHQAIPEPDPLPAVAVEPAPTKEADPVPAALPDRIVLDVPFYVQAPFAVWDEIHNETCEEAAFLMVRDYYLKQTLTKDQLEQQLQAFVAWQTENGYAYDITLQQIVDAAKARYQFAGAVITANPTVEQIKAIVAGGDPVIVPAAGRELFNPNFTPPGPPYHMVVIIGYDAEGFITNDPGTRNGSGFRYTFENLANAIHDWNGTVSNILSGRRAVMAYTLR
ncbi:MAG: C39 family peptidase [Patescibacteria group bacterium]